MFKAGAPGAGGITRGRGDAELQLGGDSPFESDEFDAQRLEAARLEDLEHTHLLGLGAAAPTVSGEGQATGQRALGADAGKSAWRRRLAPRHRRAVGAFFGGE